jgi:hypothetical protein
MSGNFSPASAVIEVRANAQMNEMSFFIGF